MPERSKARDRRPRKPYSDFPLFPHRNGCWAKKIRGGFVFFGAWGEGALRRYLAERDELHAGRAERVPPAAAKGPGERGVRGVRKRVTLPAPDRA